MGSGKCKIVMIIFHFFFFLHFMKLINVIKMKMIVRLLSALLYINDGYTSVLLLLLINLSWFVCFSDVLPVKGMAIYPSRTGHGAAGL